jgi:hypothetical protein
LLKDAGKKSKVKSQWIKRNFLFNLYVKKGCNADMKAKHQMLRWKLMIGFASESWKIDPLVIFLKEKFLNKIG